MRAALLAQADAILADDMARGPGARRGGGGPAARTSATVLTHCNAGGLATGGYGTALGVVYAAQAAGRRVRVYADETRPLLQGARLTALGTGGAGDPVTLLCDGAAGGAAAVAGGSTP